jgi:hypothetical protein
VEEGKIRVSRRAIGSRVGEDKPDTATP